MGFRKWNMDLFDVSFCFCYVLILLLFKKSPFCFLFFAFFLIVLYDMWWVLGYNEKNEIRFF